VLAKEAEWFGSMRHVEVKVPKGGVNSAYKSEVCDLPLMKPSSCDKEIDLTC